MNSPNRSRSTPLPVPRARPPHRKLPAIAFGLSAPTKEFPTLAKPLQHHNKSSNPGTRNQGLVQKYRQETIQRECESFSSRVPPCMSAKRYLAAYSRTQPRPAEEGRWAQTMLADHGDMGQVHLSDQSWERKRLVMRIRNALEASLRGSLEGFSR